MKRGSAPKNLKIFGFWDQNLTKKIARKKKKNCFSEKRCFLKFLIFRGRAPLHFCSKFPFSRTYDFDAKIFSEISDFSDPSPSSFLLEISDFDAKIRDFAVYFQIVNRGFFKTTPHEFLNDFH